MKPSERRLRNRKKYTYDAWLEMLKSNQVCDWWANSFDHFSNQMGWIPTRFHHLELKDGETLYCKKNCKWLKIKRPSELQSAIETFCNPDYIPDGYHYRL